MKVVVDALPLRHGGGVTYLAAQLTALAGIAPDVELATLVSPWSRLRDLPGTVRTVRLHSVPQRFAYELVRLPFARADVLYCPANFGPVRARAPIVLTLHNPNYYRAGLALPETAPVRPRWKLAANRAAMRSAAAVVAISQAFADDVLASAPEVAGKLHVIKSGAPAWTEPARELAAVPPAFLLTIASQAPHKRVPDVVRAWAAAGGRSTSVPPLVVVGELTGRQRAECVAAAAGHRPELHLLGPVTDRGRLRWAYERATALVSMSALEAFPLTPVEAGSLGCPLVLSDIPAHREVTLGNAVFVRPGAIDEMADALCDAAGWTPGSRRWEWPVTWADNARALRSLFDEVLQ